MTLLATASAVVLALAALLVVVRMTLGPTMLDRALSFDVLVAIAEEEGLRGPHLRLFEAIGRTHEQVLGRRLPLNGAGVCGAALADLGLPVDLLRGFALLARTAGLIGQLAEELRHPVANDVFLSVDLNNRPVDPDPLPRTDD